MRFTPPRYIPGNSCRVQTSLGVVYTYTSTSGLLAAVAYAGKATKATWHFNFKNSERRDEKIAEFFANLKSHEARKTERRTDASKPHTLKVGTIITNSWGYDQTNVDWYVVIATSVNFVTLRPIAAVSVPDAGSGPMSGHCSAAVDVSGDDSSKWGVKFTSEKTSRHRVSSQNSVNMRHGCGSVWDGRPMYESWYA